MNIAIDKHAGMSQYFCEFEDHELLHADMKVYNLLVGNNESFTIEKYTMADPEEKPPG